MRPCFFHGSRTCNGGKFNSGICLGELIISRAECVLFLLIMRRIELFLLILRQIELFLLDNKWISCYILCSSPVGQIYMV